MHARVLGAHAGQEFTLLGVTGNEHAVPAIHRASLATARPLARRRVLEIPQQEGYKKAGSPQAGIKGTDTLYFVVDIVGAA